MATTKAATSTRKTPPKAKPKTGARATRKATRAAAKPVDAIKLLKDDHREVQGWFKEYDKTDDDAKKQELADRICEALLVHTQIEEEILYPAAYEAIDDDDLLDEAEVEHASARDLIAQIQDGQVGDPLFDAKVKVLGEYIDHHVKEEESEMFPEIRSSDMDLKALGEAMAKLKQELMGQSQSRMH